MTSCRCCGIDVVGEAQRRNVEKYEIAVAVLQQFYTDETLTEFGVEQKPGPTPEDVDQAWWTVVGVNAAQGRQAHDR